MIRFIRHFLCYWVDYKGYKWFTKQHMKPEELEKLGGDPFRNRFDYAWKNTLVWWKHRDRYSKRCTGDCENCTLKHC